MILFQNEKCEFHIMKKRKSIILEELKIWLKGRFTLTSEEKFWLLLVLFICWVGLTARYIHDENKSTAPLSAQKVEDLLSP